MRIAIYHNLPSGGAKRALFEITKRLSASHYIDAYSLSTADNAFCDLRPFVQNQIIYPYEPSALFTSPLGRLNQWQRTRDLERLDEIGRIVATEIDRSGFDVVFVHHCQYTQAPLLLKYLNTPSVYYCQEALRLLYEPPITRPFNNNIGIRRYINRIDPFIRWYHRSLKAADLAAARSAGTLLANSQFSKANIDSAYNVLSSVAYLGVDTDVFFPCDEIERENFVLSVGALHATKGYDFLIDALALLPDVDRPALRIIANVGDEREQEFLENRAASAGVQLRIDLSVSNEALVDAYRRALAVVYAPVREPFGFVPIEAMSCKTAVIGVAEGGVQETIIDGETGYLVPRDPAQFARCLNRLISMPATAEAMGRAGRRVVECEWTWESAVERIEGHLFTTASLSLN